MKKIFLSLVIITAFAILLNAGDLKEGLINNIVRAIDNADMKTASGLLAKVDNFDKKHPFCKNKWFEGVLPAGSPAEGTKGDGFGWRPSPFGEGRDFHTGMDIFSSPDTFIRATLRGIVKQAEWAGGYGYLVKIDHENKIETFYAQCSKLLVKTGDRVLKGDKIAVTGNTGSVIAKTRLKNLSTQCHYEIRINGIPVNPEPFMNFSVGSNHKCTLMHYAAYKGRRETVRDLLNRGAKKNTRNEFGFDPVVMGYILNRNDLVEFFQ